MCSSGKALPMPSPSTTGTPIRPATAIAAIELPPPISNGATASTGRPTRSSTARRAATSSSPLGSFSKFTTGEPMAPHTTTRASSASSEGFTARIDAPERSNSLTRSRPMYGLPPPPEPRMAAPVAIASSASSVTSHIATSLWTERPDLAGRRYDGGSTRIGTSSDLRPAGDRFEGREAVQFLQGFSQDQVLSWLREMGDVALPLAGGTDAMMQYARGEVRPETFVHIERVEELRAVEHGERSRLGALATHRQLTRDPEVVRRNPALAEAAGAVGGWQTQAVGTIAGNICNASPAADTAPPPGGGRRRAPAQCRRRTGGASRAVLPRPATGGPSP